MPAPPPTLCHEVLGLPGAPDLICERIAVALLGADPRVRRLPDGRWGLVPEAQGSPLLDECAFAVVDVETTGMRASRAATGSPRSRWWWSTATGAKSIFDSLVNPGPADSSRGHRDHPHHRRHGPRRAARSPSLPTSSWPRSPVGSSSPTTRASTGNFVSAELRRARALTLDGHRLCTVRLARRLVSGVRSCGLDNLSVYFGIENEARHRAGGDALATAELLSRLLAARAGRGRAHAAGPGRHRGTPAVARAAAGSVRRCPPSRGPTPLPEVSA